MSQSALGTLTGLSQLNLSIVLANLAKALQFTDWPTASVIMLIAPKIVGIIHVQTCNQAVWCGGKPNSPTWIELETHAAVVAVGKENLGAISANLLANIIVVPVLITLTAIIFHHPSRKHGHQA